MAQSFSDKSGLHKAGEELSDFAVDREDIKIFIENMAPAAECKPATVEYELQLLKIITVGWAITFFLADKPCRNELAENFWQRIHEFAAQLSDTTELMTGHHIDYFQTLRQRLDLYVSALADNPEATEPAAVIGPEFAGLCGNSDDVFTVMIGSRMFITTAARVREYLDGLTLP